ncbi:hypothetical protein SCHPADRAFT_935190 [Schizopora paradoxa]|uniref:Uncharacterized protein n=1 Tax=Schizopora paradoxa TaxID=27342 RepID=A0A0H2SD68_9AGAM|nr:hypothetical protein SCHPADRAFT_935190 [Schizopora paradoxa]
MRMRRGFRFHRNFQVRHKALEDSKEKRILGLSSIDASVSIPPTPTSKPIPVAIQPVVPDPLLAKSSPDGLRLSIPSIISQIIPFPPIFSPSSPSPTSSSTILSTSITSTTITISISTTIITVTTETLETSVASSTSSPSLATNGLDDDLSSSAVHTSFMNDKSKVAGVFSVVGLIIVFSIAALVLWMRRRHAKREELRSVFPYVNKTDPIRSEEIHQVANHVFELMSSSPVQLKGEKSSKIAVAL